MVFGKLSKEELEEQIRGIKYDPKEYEDEGSISEIGGLDKDDILGREYPNKEFEKAKEK